MKILTFAGLTGLLAALFMPVGLLAQPGPAAPPKVPILETSTYLLVRIDLTRLDSESISKWIDQRMALLALPPAEGEQLRTAMNAPLDQLSQFRQAMIQAKAPVIYIALSDFPPRNPALFAPVGAGGDAEAVRSLLYSGRANGPKGGGNGPVSMMTSPLADGVFLGQTDVFARVKDAHIGAPHLLFALSTAPDAPVQVVAAPSESLTQSLETMMPQLPPPVDLPVTVVTRGVGSAVGSLKAPPELSGKIVIQAQDAAAAGQLKLAADRLLAMLASPQLQRGAPAGIDLPALIKILTPQVQGDQLILNLDGNASSTLAMGLMLPALSRGRQTAMTVQSASTLRQMLVGMTMYANDNQGNLPDTLEQLTPRYLQRVLPNPRSATNQPDYLYVKGAAKLADMKRDAIMIYENPADLPPGTPIVNAGFADGHVEAMPVAVLRQRLTAQGAPVP